MIVYIENPIDSAKKLLNLINEFGKTVGYKVSIQISKASLYTNNETSKAEIREKNPIYYSNKKNTLSRNKLIQGDKTSVLGKPQNTEKIN